MPSPLVQADFRKRTGDLVRGSDIAGCPGREAVDDSRRVSAGVSDGLDLLQQVVLFPHSSVVPFEGAKAVEVDEPAERDKLDEHPCGIGTVVPADKVAAVPVVLEAPYLTIADVQALLREAGQIVHDDGVAVLVRPLGDLAHELGLGEVLDVQGHRQQRVAQHVVDGREVLQVPEVEPHVLAVVFSTDAPVEECAVGRELEVVRLVGERLAGVLLRAKVERHALGLQVLDLLVDGELGLPRPDADIISCHFHSHP